ncbi:phage tail protein [Sorangium sp. So ce281]|uniref:phage tail protein n=1 Tax=unclassified Sorangium TaxID=2621164 RepID=UPI003F62A6D7
MSVRETLYAQLPAVYRRRDAELGGPLRALLAIVDEQLQAVQADIETAWDNAFIETAEESLVPYIGDALGLPVARDVRAIAFSRRAFVANTIGYRRRKGTAAMLELLARDLTNYPARVVEFFTRMTWDESINHPTGRPATLDIRSTIALERLGGPFEEATRSVEVRRIASGRGTHNLPNVGLFLWRTRIWPLAGVTAAPMSLAGQAAYRFSPLGEDRPLYAALETEADPTAIATEASVPLALSRRRLWAQARALGADMVWPFWIEVHGRDGSNAAVVRRVAPDKVDICDLSAIASVPAAPAHDRVEVDPQIGRFVLGADFTAGLSGVEVTTGHFIATSGDLGAGPWDRGALVQEWLGRWTGTPESRTVAFQILVLRDRTGTDIVATLDEAIQRWNSFVAGLPSDEARSRALGLILVGDSRTHAAPATAVEMPSGAVLGILGATWPDPPDGAPPGRQKGQLAADSVRPVVVGDLRVHGAGTAAANRGELLVSGLVVTGRVVALAGSLQGLRLVSATVLGASAIDVVTADADNAALEVHASRAIVGGIEAAGAIGGIHLIDTAVVGQVHAPETAMTADGSTVLGGCELGALGASSSIFAGAVTVEQHQEGCLRFCYVPLDSRTPRRFRCQPDLALEEALQVGGAAAAALVPLRVRPRFVSADPMAPGFLLLAPEAPPELRGAAEDGGEPGSWNHLQHGIRLANLRNALPQFLRFGLEPGIFFLV